MEQTLKVIPAVVEILTTEKEYRAFKALNYSSLSNYVFAPSYYLHRKTHKEPMNANFAVGGAVDTLVTGTIEEFNETYVIGTLSKRPDGNPGKLCEMLVEVFDEDAPIDDILLGNIPDRYVNKINNCIRKVYKRYKIKDVIEKVFSNALVVAYIKEAIMIKIKGKIFLSKEEFDLSTNMVRKLKLSASANHLLFEEVDHYERLFQYPIVFNFMGLRCKSLFDLLLIDHKNKQIRPIDLKTMRKKVEEFEGSFLFWRYYIQAALYTEAAKALRSEAKALHECGKLSHDISEYSIELFEFIVASKDDQSDLPLVFTVAKNTMDFLIDPVPDSKFIEGKIYSNLAKIIKDYKHSYATNDFKIKAIYSDKNHRVLLDLI